MKQAKAPINWLPATLLTSTFFAALTIVPWYGFTHGFDAFEWSMFAIFLVFNGLSITGGYHRLWSHNAYKAHPALKWFYSLWGACAMQNSILVWSSHHRRHHRYVDDNEKDPYSAKRGFWFSHIGWMLRNYPSADLDYSNARDLQRDPIVMFQHNHYAALVILMNVGLPLAIGFWHGDMLGTFLLAGVLRLVVSHHTTFFINSLAHIWGKRPYTDENTARDNGFIALLTYGEGYHNYHHIFQNDYRNGIRWWQWDPTKWLIVACSWVGLAHSLNRVSDFKIQKALVTMQFKRANERLNKTSNAEIWKQYLEQEYQQFMESMNEWRSLQQEWYQHKRQQFQEKKEELMRKWEQAAFHTRFQELEYALKMQQKRLQLLAGQMA